MKGIFHTDRCYLWKEDPWPSEEEIRALDPIEDRRYLEYMVQYALGWRRKRIMKKLGISEPPEPKENMEDRSDTDYTEYFVLEEQVAREPDAEVLKEAVYEAPTQMAKFAFCYLTNYCYFSPWCDAYSYRTYRCGWKEGMTTEDVVEFCREMIAVQGPFVREAEEILADPPRDHRDENGDPMVSHERAASGPPYVRRERLAPFRESEEYEQSRAEVLQLEAQAGAAFASGGREKAIELLMEMSRKAKQLGKYTQRWDSIDDYARCCIAMAEAGDYSDSAEEAAEILRRLIRECPEETAYREQLKKAEAVFRKAREEAAVQSGFMDAESPILICHSFEPKYAEVFCRLLAERFRERGGKREICFQWQASAPPAWEDFAQAQRRPEINWQLPAYEVGDHTDHMLGDICCCDLPTMIKLYCLTGNIDRISPFIDTDNVFPALLEQSRINRDVCGIPVLLFAGAAEGTADSGAADTAAGQAAGLRTVFAAMDNYSYGYKDLDCLDLMKLMTDSDFLFDVCRACNEGDITPHVFPADRTACVRLAGKEPGYAAVLNLLENPVERD